MFPIHRSVRFAACCATRGAPTRAMACRMGETERAGARAHPRRGPGGGPFPAEPHVRGAARVGRRGRGRARRARSGVAGAATAPGRATPGRVRPSRLGRAVRPRAQRDRRSRRLPRPSDGGRPTPTRVPVVEGKHLDPFTVNVRQAAWRLPAAAAARRRGHRFDVARLAFRDVAGGQPAHAHRGRAAGGHGLHPHPVLPRRGDGRHGAAGAVRAAQQPGGELVRAPLGEHPRDRRPGGAPACAVGAARGAGVRAPAGRWRAVARRKASRATPGWSCRRRRRASTACRRRTLARVLDAFPLIDRARREGIAGRFGEGRLRALAGAGLVAPDVCARPARPHRMASAEMTVAASTSSTANDVAKKNQSRRCRSPPPTPRRARSAWP